MSYQKPRTFVQHTLLLLTFFSSFSLLAQQRLSVSPHMIINTSARGDAWLLFDNQPLSNTSCIPAKTDNEWNFFDATWNGQTFFYPVSVVIDYGSPQNLNQICFREGWNFQSNVQVETSNYPTGWQPLLTHYPGQGECHTFGNTNARFVRFSFASNAARVREIEVYGTQNNAINCPPAPSHNGFADLKMQDFIGINTNIDIPPAKTLPFGFIRNYQGIFANTGYDDPNAPAYPNNEYAWAPNNSGKFDFDIFFRSLRDVGKTINSTIHRAPPYLVTFEYHNGNPNYTAATPFANEEISLTQFYNSIERKPFSEKIYPIQPNMIIDDPNAYLEFSDIFYQFTSRYGSQPQPPSTKLKPNNEAKSGLGYVQYLENWNEPDKWWHVYLMQGLPYLNPEIEQQLGYYSPAEYAAMSSATIDGNGSTNGIENILKARYPNQIPNGAGPVSIRSADPDMKLVMAGLSEPNIEYVKAVKFWFDYHRPDLEFPFKVINFHDYSNNSNNGNAIGQYAISPEEDRLREKMEKVVHYRNQNLPGVEVWLSEFGYDTNPYSPQSPDCERWCGDCSAPSCIEQMRELQGQWLVRSYLELAAAGVDRAMAFTIRDGAPENLGGLYSTSGMVTHAGVDSNEYFNKPAWYYISTMKQTLEDTKYDPSFQHLDPNVRMYRFMDNSVQPAKKVYALWSPTSWRGDGESIYNNYNLTFINSNAQVISMEAGETDGKRRQISTCNGVPCVNIGERPIFIVEGDLKEDVSNCDCNYLNVNLSGNGNYLNLIDEATQRGKVYCADGNAMQSFWTPNALEEVIVDLGSETQVEHLFLHGKRHTRGQLEISYGSPNNWTLLDNWEVRNLIIDQWKVFADLGINTRYLRLKAKATNLQIGELAICGQKGTTVVTPTCTDGIQNGNETAIDCGGSCPPCSTDDNCLIPLSNKQFYYPNGTNATDPSGAGSLMDEQENIGDVVNGNGLEVNNPWQLPWVNNAKAYLDLGQEYDLQDIYLYDGYGSGQFQVAAGLPQENQAPLVDFNANIWPPQWRTFALNTRTRYLTFTKVDPGAKINEIALCGTPASSPIPLHQGGTFSPTPCQVGKLYPNPTKDNFVIPNHAGNLAGVEIYATDGRLVLKQAFSPEFGKIQIPVRQLLAGIYMVKMQLTEGCGVSYEKLLVQ